MGIFDGCVWHSGHLDFFPLLFRSISKWKKKTKTVLGIFGSLRRVHYALPLGGVDDSITPAHQGSVAVVPGGGPASHLELGIPFSLYIHNSYSKVTFEEGANSSLLCGGSSSPLGKLQFFFLIH